MLTISLGEAGELAGIIAELMPYDCIASAESSCRLWHVWVPVQWRLVVGALALAMLALQGPVLSFRQRFFHADHIIA